MNEPDERHDARWLGMEVASYLLSSQHVLDTLSEEDRVLYWRGLLYSAIGVAAQSIGPDKVSNIVSGLDPFDALEHRSGK